MVTIADVAKEAGVSVATVSRVTNRSSLVSYETAEKVNVVIDRLNYKPNVFGQNLRRKGSNIILIIIPNISNPYYSPIVSGIESVFFQKNLLSILCISENRGNNLNNYLEFLINGIADGAIIFSIEKNDSKFSKIAKDYPIVQCSEYCKDETIPNVSIDNYRAAYQIIDYLLGANHRKIGLISSCNQFISTELRENGYVAAMNDAGLNNANDYIAYADSEYSFKSGRCAAKDLLNREDRPSAIFCVSDIIALAAISVANELNLHVPEDVSIVGFDNVEYAAMFSPRLTTVAQPCFEMGKVSAELISDIIAGDKKGGHIFLDHKIVVRESTSEANYF